MLLIHVFCIISIPFGKTVFLSDYDNKSSILVMFFGLMVPSHYLNQCDWPVGHGQPRKKLTKPGCHWRTLFIRCRREN